MEQTDSTMIQISCRIADTAFDIIIDGNPNGYNPTIVDDAISKIKTLIKTTIPEAQHYGYTYPTPTDEDEDEDEQ